MTASYFTHLIWTPQRKNSEKDRDLCVCELYQKEKMFSPGLLQGRKMEKTQKSAPNNNPPLIAPKLHFLHRSLVKTRSSGVFCLFQFTDPTINCHILGQFGRQVGWPSYGRKTNIYRLSICLRKWLLTVKGFSLLSKIHKALSTKVPRRALTSLNGH